MVSTLTAQHVFFTFFFFNDPATTEIYTLSLHDALPIFENQKELTKMQLDNQKEIAEMQNETQKEIAGIQSAISLDRKSGSAGMPRPISYAVFCLKKKKN